MVDKTLTPTLRYHPLLRGGLTPTIHHWGQRSAHEQSDHKNPSYQALKPYQPIASDCFDYAQRKESRQSPARSSRWQSQNDDLDIQQDSGTMAYLYYRLFDRYETPLQASQQFLFEREVDVLHPDGKISEAELAHYLYRVDQAGNKDGIVSQDELNFGQFIAQKRFLMEQGAELGLTKKELIALYQKLRSNQFTATTSTLEEANDVIGQQTDTRHAIERMNKIIENWERCRNWTHQWLPEESNMVLGSLLKHFCQSGSMPLPHYTDQQPGQGAHPLSFIMLEGYTSGGGDTAKKREIGALKSLLFWMEPTKRSQTDDPLSARLLKTWPRKKIKKPHQYRFKPEVISKPNTKEAQQLHDTLAGLSHRLQAQLNHPNTQPHLETFVQNIAHSLHNPHLMAIRLYPLFEAMGKALDLDPGHVQFLVKNTLNSDQKIEGAGPKQVIYGICEPFYQGEIPHVQKVSTQISLSRSAFAHYYQKRTEQYKTEQYERQNRNDLAKELLQTLVEEMVHAWQFQMMARQGDNVYLRPFLPQNRILDYQECQACPYPDFPLMKAYTGRSDLYEKSPIEVDAKWVATTVSEKMMDAIRQIQDAEPILLSPA